MADIVVPSRKLLDQPRHRFAARVVDEQHQVGSRAAADEQRHLGHADGTGNHGTGEQGKCRYHTKTTADLSIMFHVINAGKWFAA